MIIAVVFDSQGYGNAKQYHYLCNDDSVKVNDYCVVENSGQYHTLEFSIVKVVAVNVTSKQATKAIVSKVDVEAYKAAKEKLKKKQELEKQLDKLLAETQKLVIYEQFAASNPAIAELLKELKSL